MRLDLILQQVPELKLLSGQPGVAITGVTYDSRQVEPGGLFFALRGQRTDGHEFLGAAITAGAVAVCTECPDLLPPAVPPDIAVLTAVDGRAAMAAAASALHGHPARSLFMIGVTGTKGKTTTTHLIRAVLEAAGHRTGLVGTVHNVAGGRVLPVRHTTPESADLQELLAQMVAAGDTHAVMEVSSHALAMQRVDGIRFAIAALTNIGHDHLDYHLTQERYIAAKALLFAGLTSGSAAAVNGDDPASATMTAAVRPGVAVWSYGLSPGLTVHARDLRLRATGAAFDAVTPAGIVRIVTHLPGRFNVYNVLAALTVVLAGGCDLEKSAAALAEVRGVPGRFERVTAGQPFAVIVDYAHTPESLRGVLETAREITGGRLTVVFGCGGDRDRTRRPVMGRLAAELADRVIVTSDNPRGEDPERIIDEIVAGIPARLRPAWTRTADRSGAIAAALAEAQAEDVVVIAGKGHETYQITGSLTTHFDDREEAAAALARLGYVASGETRP